MHIYLVAVGGGGVGAGPGIGAGIFLGLSHFFEVTHLHMGSPLAGPAPITPELIHKSLLLLFILRLKYSVK